MTDNVSQLPLDEPAQPLARTIWLLWVAAALFLGASLLPGGAPRLALTVSGLSLVVLVAAMAAIHSRKDRGIPKELKVLQAFLETEAAPSFILDTDQAVIWRNEAARTLCPGEASSGLEAMLRPLSPESGAILRRLRRGLLFHSFSSEEVSIRRGHARFVARGFPQGYALLRLEALTERSASGGSSLAVPAMTVSRSGTVLAMSEAARRLTGFRARRLEDLFVEVPGPGAGQATLSTGDGQKEVALYHTELSGGRREILFLDPESFERKRLAGMTIDNLPVAVLKMRPDGEILEINSPARALLRQPESGPLPAFPEVVAGLGRSVSSWLETALQSARPVQPEILRVRAAEEDSFLQVTLTRAPGDIDPVITAVLHDATELKTLEAQFVQSQKMQAIGQLAGGVAHDFNNLLTAISGHCDLLLLRHDPGDAEYSDLVQINQNANRAASLVGQLLAFSRKQTLQPEVVDLRECLSDLIHLLNRLVGEKVTLTLLNDPDLCTMRADKRQLEQVLVNLVFNARDAMPEGGGITIETERVLLAEPLIRGRANVPPGEYACVKVVDEGVGIPIDKISKIFEPFFTTKRTGEGTGLGLSTAYGIVKQSGGFIFAKSVVGKGTEFQLFFPAYHAREPAPEVSTPSVPVQTAERGEGVVLLVEDEAPVRAFAARALRMNGYTVLEADSGESALETLENGALEVDIFVSDVIMPGLDGPSWVRLAREARPDVKIVFMSGYAEDLLSEEASPIRNSVFLPKPFSLTQLTATVGAQLS